MDLRTLIGDGPAGMTAGITAPLDPCRVIIAEALDLDAAERAYIASADIGLVEGWSHNAAGKLSAFLRGAEVEQLYVHLDADVFGPGSYGDGLFSVPDRPSLEAVGSTVRELVDAFDVVGVGVVESCGRQPGTARALCGFLVDCVLWEHVD